VIIALIIYTMTMEKLKQIATLKLIGAPDRTIIGMIVQQALALGAIGFEHRRLMLIAADKGLLPAPRGARARQRPGARRHRLVVVCLLASGLGVRAALRVDPQRHSEADAMPEPKASRRWSRAHASRSTSARGDARRCLRDVIARRLSGEVVALLGPSGSGKTTLLNVIGCILDPSAGSMARRRDGLRRPLVVVRTSGGCGSTRSASSSSSTICCRSSTRPTMSPSCCSWPAKSAGEAGAGRSKLLDYLEVGNRKHAMPAKLSGGEAQRVAIARALANSRASSSPTSRRRRSIPSGRDRHGPAAQARRRAGGRDHRRHPRREDLRSLRPHLPSARWSYVNRQRQVKTGTLISSLAMAGDMTRPPDTHVVYCDGDYPCKADGTPIQAISHQSAKIDLGKGLTAQHTFSSKPAEGYRDYHQKMSTYAAILSGPATTLKSAAPQLLGHQRRVVSHTLTLPF
jgi:hypothetical protein